MRFCKCLEKHSVRRCQRWLSPRQAAGLPPAKWFFLPLSCLQPLFFSSRSGRRAEGRLPATAVSSGPLWGTDRLRNLGKARCTRWVYEGRQSGQDPDSLMLSHWGCSNTETAHDVFMGKDTEWGSPNPAEGPSSDYESQVARTGHFDSGNKQSVLGKVSPGDLSQPPLINPPRVESWGKNSCSRPSGPFASPWRLHHSSPPHPFRSAVLLSQCPDPISHACLHPGTGRRGPYSCQHTDKNFPTTPRGPLYEEEPKPAIK